MAHISDKKERLVTAAKDLFHRKGFNQTTLVDISRESGVPLGNVYYYFKTKEDIAAAVIAQRTEEFRAMTKDWERNPDPAKRLTDFLDMPLHIREAVALHGCPFGSLAHELCREQTLLADQARKLLSTMVDWVAEQFRLMGDKDATDSAMQLTATVQGISVLASTYNNPKIVEEQIRILKKSLPIG